MSGTRWTREADWGTPRQEWAVANGCGAGGVVRPVDLSVAASDPVHRWLSITAYVRGVELARLGEREGHGSELLVQPLRRVTQRVEGLLGVSLSRSIRIPLA